MKSLSRIVAIFIKELVHLRRDTLTLALIIGSPILQLILFGFAINTDPRHLPAAVELRDDGPLTRSFLATLKQSSYFDFVARVSNSAPLSTDLVMSVLRDGSRYPLDMFWHIARTTPLTLAPPRDIRFCDIIAKRLA